MADDMERKLTAKTDGLSILPGVAALLEKIPLASTAVCTAGTRHMAENRLTQVGLDVPKVMSTGDSVR